MTTPREIRFVDSYIDGAWRTSESRLDVIDPATGGSLARIATASVADCLDAVDAANRAFDGWRRTAPRQRAEVLRRAFELMVAEVDALAELIVAENGKIFTDARGEVLYAAEFFRWFAEEAVRIDGDYRTAPGGDNWLMVTRQPVGVALLITPWNFPAAMATRKIGPALAAGCTVVLKAAAETPLTALALADLLERAGVPGGVVNVVVPDPPGEAVEAMLRGGGVHKLSFTGSTRVGSMLLEQAAPRVINCSMELGGNAPFVVTANADVDRALEGAMIAKLRNGGAACTAANRFYVHEAVVAEFTDRLVDRMAGVKLGPGMDPASGLGPMVSHAQQQRIAAAVNRGVADGARLLLGGELPVGDDFGYPTTVLDQVDPSSWMIGEELFGPVAPIVTYRSTDEMLEWANAVDLGLVGYVFSADAGEAMRIAESLEVGMVGLNRGLVSDPAAPFGGVKQSGLGREGGHDGLLAFLETKYIAGTW